MIALAEVLRRHWPAYERQYASRIPPTHRRAVQCLLNCRTRALGGEVYRCGKCARDHFVYHSCQHRACPQCGHAAATEWLAQQQGKLLPVPYYLITFTVPEGLRAWLRAHPQTGYAGLLRESAGALQDVGRNPKYLGGELGCLSVLHTWGRQLQYHPHVHCVVPAGGLHADGLRWVRPKSPDFFLPQIVLAARFRNRLKAAFAEAPAALRQIPARVWRQKWVVDVRAVGSGAAALQYLAAYVSRTALGNQRILRDAGGRITFKYQAGGERAWRTLTLAAPEFLRRFLQHVLPQGFPRVRYYGWLAAAAKGRWQRILALLDWHAPARVMTPQPQPLCPCCGGPLCWLGTLARAPP